MKLNVRLVKWNFRSVRSRLILTFAVILIVPSLSIGLFSYNSAKQTVDNQMKRAAVENVHLLNQMITGMMEIHMKQVDFLSQTVTAEAIGLKQGDEDPNLRELLDRYKRLHPELENVFIGADNGGIMTSPIVKLPPDFDSRKRSWYIEAMENKGQVIISEPYISQSTNNVVVSVAKVVNDGHGVVAFNINLKALSDLVKEVKIGKQGYVALIDAQRKYLAHPTLKPGEPAPAGTVIDGIFASASGALDFVNPYTGLKNKNVFTTNELTGWKLSAVWLMDEVTQEAAPIYKRTVLVIGVALLAGAVFVFFIIRSIIVPLRKLIDMSRKISEGYLNERVNVRSKDEFGDLGASFNQMTESLRTVLLEVSDTSNQLAASSQQLTASADQSSKATEHIADSMEKIADGANEQAQTVEQSAETIQVMSAKIKDIALRAQSVADTSSIASEKSSEGARAIQNAIGQMSSINGSVNGLAQVITQLAAASQEIGQITTAITQIAQQTNLLSLNASIEAARAGEQGRGFAIVANEVKKLSEQSSNSAEQIAELIESIRDEIDKAQQSMQTAAKEVGVGMEVVHSAGSLFSEIERFVDDVGSQVREVSEATQHISDGTQQVVQSIQAISAVAQTSASGTQNVSAAAEEQLASMEEITASSSALTQMAGELQEIVDKFKL
ncbi:methyl-accepting chemotaxis protein [Paenibacillus beijingensis]|uniref:Chemotaxis protein n=1 Tax=Paenibacillus beijingensis TaxID=1126833 RepID=A0A0D5NP86_9BACL|nr:methyl-accepting chemotaxis protein [Paenibacillus beijingensis]AJY76718.1 chemotaxis protein [Paenibacillus beijingensis]